ncbi:DsbA family protein [Psychromonas algicola]|uniref:DsbA family protein n=1 Tax=Psychromonas algicola TaxID=2555642 RepID=UPI001067CE2C|nr:DsbA family protein [Psychromonas sp. RZ5]TEW43034.1 DsbA family protein [Psychromonas sp. RZ5]
MKQPILYYVYDPMCSWCWGYRNTWLKLSDNLVGKVAIQYQLGGLAPDSDVVMPIELQASLQGIWRNIQEQLGTEFNFDFWQLCTPQRSTYPACRACLIAREEGKELEMLFAIQQAYYLQAKNPSLKETLIDLAGNIGLNVDEFKSKLTAIEINKKLEQEIGSSRQLPIQGFPSLVLELDGKYLPIQVDYLDWQKTYSQIMSYLN